jgi:signal transduction histidine kinase
MPPGGGQLAVQLDGVVGLKDRVEALDGRLSVRSVPGADTTLEAELPPDAARAVPG